HHRGRARVHTVALVDVAHGGPLPGRRCDLAVARHLPLGRLRAGDRHCQLLRRSRHPPMYQAPGRSRPYYRCASRSIGGRSCGNGSIQADVLEQLTAELFLARVGHLDVMRKVYIAGEDHTDEINRIEEALARLVQRLEKLPDGGPAEAAILTRMREHETRLHELQAKPRPVDQW